ncbi:hypothetical protein ACJMK2_024628 [Sinanodonta woodiana]|uniref:Uncharacterized protein n=1 Tax=Sinanodonta woodiana TaxID=1069815 RepID=A0ABD3XGD3_SINWO
MEEVYRKIAISLIFIAFNNCVKGWPPRLQINDVEALSPYAIKLSWTTRHGHASASRDISYTVRYKEKGGTYEYVDVLDSEAKITDLEPDTVYVLSVRSVSVDKEGAWSKHVISTTMSEHIAGDLTNVTLPVPEIVSGHALSPHSIKLVWTIKNRKGALDVTYNVRYLFRSGHIEYIDVNNTEVTLKFLMPNTTYMCSVRSVLDDVTSDWSKQHPVTTMEVSHSEEASKIVTVTEVSSRYVTVTWSEPAILDDRKITGYRLALRKEKEGSTSDVVVQKPPYKLSKLEPNSHYSVSIYALFKNGKQKLGTSRFVTAERVVNVPPPPPRKLKTKLIGNKNILVKWRPPENNSVTSYILRYKRRKSEPKELCQVHIDGSKRKYIIKGVRSNSKYGVQLASFHHSTTGPFTDWVIEKTPPLVTSSSTQSSRFKVFAVAPHEVVVVWKSKTSRPEDSTYLEVWKEDSYLYQVQVTGWHYFMLHNLTAGDTYTFVLKELIGLCPRNRIIQLRMDTSAPVAAVNETCARNYDPLLRCLPSPDTGVVVTWIPISECKTFYIIRVYEGDRQDAHTGSFVVEDKVSQAKLSFLKNNQTYVIVLSTFNKLNGQLLYESSQLILRPRETVETIKDVGQPLAVPLSYMDLLLYRPRVNSSWLNVPLTLTAGNSSLTRKFEGKDTWMYLTLPVEFLSQNITISYGRVTDEIELRSKEAVPPNVMNMRDIIAIEGETVQLRCFSAGDPYPDLEWRREGREIPAQDRGRIPSVSTRYINSFTKSTNHPLFIRESVFTLQSLRQGDSGNYSCVATNTAGSSNSSLLLLVKGRPPKQVRNVRAVSVTPYEVQMDWTAPYGAVNNSTTYKIYFKKDEDYNTTVIDVGTSLFYTLLNLTPDTLYTAEVTAFNEGSQGERGRNIYFRTLPLPKLSIPRNVELKTINSSTIVITWLPPLMVSNRFLYIRKYSVHYRRLDTRFATEVDIDKDSHAYILSGLQKDAAYEIRVLAMTIDRQVSYSGWLEGVTYREAYLNESVPPPPPFDLDLRVMDGNILIKWYASNHTDFLVRGFVINVSLNDTLIQSLVVHHEENSILIHDADPGSNYTIEVRTKNNMGLSDPVSRTIYIPDEDVTAYPVSNFTGYPVSATALSLEWVRPESGRFSKYILSYGVADSNTSTGSGDLPAYTTNYIVRSLRPYTKYFFTITPYLKGKAGNASSVTVRTYSDVPDEPPANISITAIDATKILVQCHPPANGSNGEIISYKIVYKAAHERGFYIRQSDQLQRLNWTWDGLYPNINYDVRIHAMTSNGTGPGSSIYSVSTLKPVTEAPKAPDAPKSIQVESLNNTIAVTWELASNNTQQLLGFVIGYGKFIPEVYRVILPASARNFTINDIDSNTRYIVSARSFNVFGESKAIFDLIDT